MSSATNGDPNIVNEIKGMYSEIGLIDTGPVMVIGWMPKLKKVIFFIGVETRYGLIKNFKFRSWYFSSYTPTKRLNQKEYNFFNISIELGIGF